MRLGLDGALSGRQRGGGVRGVAEDLMGQDDTHGEAREEKTEEERGGRVQQKQHQTQRFGLVFPL